MPDSGFIRLLQEFGFSVGDATILFAIICVGIFIWRQNKSLKDDFNSLRNDFKDLSKDFTKLIQACNNAYARTTRFLAFVAAETGLKSEYSEHLADDFIPTGTIDNLTGASPLKLSDRGIEVAKRLQAEKTANAELPNLLELVNDDSTTFEIRQACFGYAFGDFFKNLKGKLRQKIHAEAFHDRGNMQNVLSVYGILFRDAVFEKLDIRIEE